MSIIESADQLSLDEKMKQLGGMTAIGSTSERINDLQRQVFERARSILITIPGHAEYYSKQFEAERVKAVWENEKRAAYGSGPWWEGYDRVRKSGFRTLEQLPTPETVRVLGEMLQDERDHQTAEFMEANPDLRRTIGSNSEVAAGTLSRLGIALSDEAVPKRSKSYRPPEFWRVWYEQVKSGTRTFHFEGDPQEYNLRGPVNVAKAPVTEREAKERTGARESAGVHGKSVTTSGNSATRPVVPWIVASLIFVLSVGYYLLRRSKQPAG